jgi:hypothetical protein
MEAQIKAGSSLVRVYRLFAALSNSLENYCVKAARLNSDRTYSVERETIFK